MPEIGNTASSSEQLSAVEKALVAAQRYLTTRMSAERTKCSYFIQCFPFHKDKSTSPSSQEAHLQLICGEITYAFRAAQILNICRGLAQQDMALLKLQEIKKSSPQGP